MNRIYYKTALIFIFVLYSLATPDQKIHAVTIWQNYKCNDDYNCVPFFARCQMLQRI